MACLQNVLCDMRGGDGPQAAAAINAAAGIYSYSYY